MNQFVRKSVCLSHIFFQSRQRLKFSFKINPRFFCNYPFNPLCFSVHWNFYLWNFQSTSVTKDYRSYGHTFTYVLIHSLTHSFIHSLCNDKQSLMHSHIIQAFINSLTDSIKYLDRWNSADSWNGFQCFAHQRWWDGASVRWLGTYDG